LANNITRKRVTNISDFVHVILKLLLHYLVKLGSLISAVYNDMAMSEMSKQLLRRLPKHEVGLIFFTDEKNLIVTPT